MTDKEIMQMLEKASIDDMYRECSSCDCRNTSWCDNADGCVEHLAINALDLIKRQQEEIEKLTDSDKRLREGVALILNNENGIELIKAEAIKEFADKIYSEITNAIISNGKAIVERVDKHGVDRYEDNFCSMCDGKIMALGGIKFFIKDLVKEMVGADNG